MMAWSGAWQVTGGLVADEVRNLAQRSAQAARDTAALIEESVERAQAGARKVDTVGQAIRVITDSVARVRGLVDDVSVASRQQAQGIDQVSQALTQMERVTQSMRPRRKSAPQPARNSPPRRKRR